MDAPIAEDAVDTVVETDAWTLALPDLEALAGRAVGAAWAVYECRRRAGGAPSAVHARAPVAIGFLDDAAVRALNAAHRGLDKPTNVLAFEPAPSPEPHLGDIALAYETVAAEAQGSGVSLADRTLHMIIHAMFHLFGYSHDDDADAHIMERAEAAALALLGVGDPYEDDEPHA